MSYEKKTLQSHGDTATMPPDVSNQKRISLNHILFWNIIYRREEPCPE